jgi:hypothetical protein
VPQSDVIEPLLLEEPAPGIIVTSGISVVIDRPFENDRVVDFPGNQIN